MKRVVILGATGSIGVQALEVASGNPDLRVVALAANASTSELCTLATAHGVDRIALAEAGAAREAAGFDGQVLAGPEGIVRLVEEAEADVVLNAIVGAAGLDASLAALRSGADLALANKESLVAGGPLVLDALGGSSGLLLPVDSEHSALMQCLAGEPAESLESVVLTASGGPFRNRAIGELAGVTPADALAHPTWDMGAKITIDSATLMNKGLEVIEAHFLFGLSYDRIEVVVHPQSIVHGMARFRDGALIAHVGYPDMRVPISYALTYPARAATPAPALDLSRPFTLEFEPPDTAAFPCLGLARAAGETGGTAPAVLNAANEEAVGAFLDGRARFTDIPALVEDALAACSPEPVDGIEAVRAADTAARERVRLRLGAGAGV
jgi:1-deoxy-D-xylulose-5-phosphate reductoisomerase